MNITTFSDYTLRVLIYLATHDGEKASAQTIAEAYGISFHHVAKAAQWLAREGYVISERGRAGGMTLGRAAETINIGHILRATEDGSVLVDCMHANGGTCCIRPSCGLKSALAEAQAAFYATLDKFSLADISAQRSALRALLG
ncbi:MAG: Rrf2 family transcriptional regulator [Maricaulaceae bacterium]